MHPLTRITSQLKRISLSLEPRGDVGEGGVEGGDVTLTLTLTVLQEEL
jgi:hypothetical protein